MKIEEINYIIVQAGGKGTRLEHLTVNKPKALVSIDNRPMLFHLFENFPDKRFIIIADYKSDVLKIFIYLCKGKISASKNRWKNWYMFRNQECY